MLWKNTFPSGKMNSDRSAYDWKAKGSQLNQPNRQRQVWLVGRLCPFCFHARLERIERTADSDLCGPAAARGVRSPTAKEQDSFV